MLSTLCVTTAADFNAFYGDKDLDGMYESGGPRIWVLGTVGEYLVYLYTGGQIDGRDDDYGAEFDRLQQQLLQAPCVTFIPLQWDDASDN